MASGTVPIPKTSAQIKFSAGGGIAAVVVFSLIGYWIACGHAPTVVVGIDNVQTFQDQDGQRLTVQASYHINNLSAAHSVYLESSWTEKFEQPVRIQLDKPAEKQTTFDLTLTGNEAGALLRIRLIVQDRDGRVVATSNIWEAKTPLNPLKK